MNFFFGTNNTNKENKKSNKKVNFQVFNEIYIIPSIEELKKNGQLQEIWWTSKELNLFRKSFIYKVDVFLKTNPHLDYKVAIKDMLEKGK